MRNKDNTTAKSVYIASKAGEMEDIVSGLKTSLEEMGYEINYDWTQYPVLKPYEKNIDQANQAADNMAHAVMRCDILIVLTTTEGGVGYHIEMGGALVTSIILSFITGQKQKDIYIVGGGNKRSVFYFHKSVKRVPDIPTLLKMLDKIN